MAALKLCQGSRCWIGALLPPELSSAVLLSPILLQHPQRTAWTPQVLPQYEPSWLSSSCWAWLCVKGWFWSYWSVIGGLELPLKDSSLAGQCPGRAE